MAAPSFWLPFRPFLAGLVMKHLWWSFKRTSFFMLIYMSLAPLAFGSASSKPRRRAASAMMSRSELQSEFFAFSAELFKWTAFFASLRRDNNEPLKEIYFRIEKEKTKKMADIFNQYKPVLVALSTVADLNIVHHIDVIPQPVFDFMRERFALKSLKDELDGDKILVKIVGGDFDFGDGKSYTIASFITCIESLEMNSWAPVRKFIRSFHDTLTLDARLSQQIGKTLLPMVQHYYRYMDVVSRLRLFKELATDINTMDLTGKNLDDDTDTVAVKIFQNSGPVMIKLLQQLQEEVVGVTPMTKVLAALKHSKAMSSQKAEALAREEIQRLTGQKKLSESDFKFKKNPLGIASIAQTHMFSWLGVKYVVKIQKERMADVYEREKKSLQTLVTSEPEFDKGMKQKISNTDKGIFEEIDFNYERNNLLIGREAYANQNLNISTVGIPKKFKGGDGRASPAVLIMTLAAGEPLGKVMERGDIDELHDAYEAVKNLYEQFLVTALYPNRKQNFYHGDLHRENIFFDIKSKLITLIDFGNAGILDDFMRQSIMNIFEYTKQTETDDEEKLDQAIVNLASVLQTFILKYNQERIRNSQVVGPLIKTYFRACFNPVGTVQEKINENGEMQVKKAELEALIRQLELGGAREGVKERVALLQDDIDFIKALMNNCLNGPTNELLSALASQALISDKLNLVFQELLKNGIAMPKEVIFFNKSKSLLEGILTNLAQTLENDGAVFDYVEPDAIYKRVLEAMPAPKSLREAADWTPPSERGEEAGRTSVTSHRLNAAGHAESSVQVPNSSDRSSSTSAPSVL